MVRDRCARISRCKIERKKGERKGRMKRKKKIKRKNKKKTLYGPAIPKGDHRKLNISSEKWRFLLINFFQYRVEFLLNGQQLKQWLEGWNTQRKVMCKFSLRVAVPFPRQGETKARQRQRKPDTNRVPWRHFFARKCIMTVLLVNPFCRLFRQFWSVRVVTYFHVKKQDAE